MKIYSDRLTRTDVYNAFARARAEHHADIHIEDLSTWKPRKYSNGIEVHAGSISGTRAANKGSWRDTPLKAASWDDWGYVIAELYSIDPHARIGFYDNKADFIRKVHQDGANRKSDFAFLGVLECIS